MTTGLTFISNLSLIALIAFTGCSSSQQGQQDEPVNGQQGENSAEDQQLENPSLNGNAKKTAEGESMNNATAPATNNFSGANPANGASVNNALLDNPAITNPTAVPLNQSTPINTGNPALANGATPPASNAVPPPNNAAAPAPAAEAPKTGNVERMNASPFTNPQMNWPGKGKVKYVTRRTTRHAAPNGPVVGEMDTGDHPLIYQNGNWVELHNGTFIKGNSMTDKPVGYERRASH